LGGWGFPELFSQFKVGLGIGWIKLMGQDYRGYYYCGTGRIGNRRVLLREVLLRTQGSNLETFLFPGITRKPLKVLLGNKAFPRDIIIQVSQRGGDDYWTQKFNRPFNLPTIFGAFGKPSKGN